MHIVTHAGGLAMTNAHLIADETTKQAVLFDAPDHTIAPLLDAAQKRGWDVVGLWLTHGHFDHFADHPLLRQRFPKAQILIHAAEELKVTHPEIQVRLFGLPIEIAPLKPDAYVTDGQMLKLGSMDVKVIHTPGHAPGHVVYYFPNEKVLVGGDMIIGGSVGRTDLPDSDHRQMAVSLKKIMMLSDDTKLLPGHGANSTIGDERETNFCLRDFLEG
jgi:glyoxylase-like metal-dependent hydrolase (beta-lactamase superfamily II)